MFEINIDNNLPRISLARAAQLTGYHQDYLGQLCRLGKLPATKVGRNWFTSAAALNSLSASMAPDLTLEQAMEEVVTDSESADEVSEQLGFSPSPEPVISQNITVSEVEGMPISVQTIAASTRGANNVQSILTNMRIESLQGEVSELRQLLFKLMQEVKAHAGILESQEIFSRVQDSLKHSYVSNFDLNGTQSSRTFAAFDKAQQLHDAALEENNLRLLVIPDFKRQYELVEWMTVLAAIVGISFIGFSAIAGSFLGTQEEVKTVHYRSDIKPSVAGAETPIQQELLPTDSAGELMPNVIQ